jgi:hypothetical protein
MKTELSFTLLPFDATWASLENHGNAQLFDFCSRKVIFEKLTNVKRKKLMEYGYLEQARATHDRRTMRLRLTRSGKRIADHLMLLNSKHAGYVGAEDGLAAEIADTTMTLRRLDRAWGEFLTFG